MVGIAPAQHVELLKGSTLTPDSRELMAVDLSPPVYNEGTRAARLTPESWALVHYLSFGNPARTK